MLVMPATTTAANGRAWHCCICTLACAPRCSISPRQTYHALHIPGSAFSALSESSISDSQWDDLGDVVGEHDNRDDDHDRECDQHHETSEYEVAARAWPGIAAKYEDDDDDDNNIDGGDDDDDDSNTNDDDGSSVIPSVYNATVSTDVEPTPKVDARFLKARDRAAKAAAKGSAIFWAERKASSSVKQRPEGR